MTVTEAIRTRESCRSYSDRPVEREKLIACLEAARIAPSACNSQPWKYVAVRSPEALAAVRPCVQKLGMNKFTDACTTLVVVCEEPAALSAKLGGKISQQQYAQMDVGISVAHFCLAATEQGLSTCILGWIQPEKLRAALGLGEDELPRLVLAVGYAAEEGLRPKKRREPGDVYTVIE